MFGSDTCLDLFYIANMEKDINGIFLSLLQISKKWVPLIVNLIILFSFTIRDHLPEGFVYLEDEVHEIKIDLRYYSSNNFVGDTIDGYKANTCIITKEAARALADVQRELGTQGLGLLVFDAYRPQQAVNHFITWAGDLEDTLMKSNFYPDIEKSALFEQGYISSKSGHSRGSTVDLTIIHLAGPNKGKEMEMGTPWDFFSPMSWPSSNQVSPAQQANRMLLQDVMVRNGFKPLKEEWWHFTLKNEPFHDTYYNFPVE